MNIAIFSDTFFPQINGVANVAHQSALALSLRGHNVMVFVPAEKSKKKIIQDQEKYKVVFLPSLPLGVYPGERLASPFGVNLILKLRAFKPDIIHAHTPFAAGWAALLGGKISSAKIITTHHTFFDHYLKHIKLDYDWGKKLSWKYTVAFCNQCDVVLSPTQSLAEGLVSHGLNTPVEILLNPVDTALFHPALEKISHRKLLQKTLIYMGRLSYEKSVDKAIEAFVKARVHEPSLILVIVGDGPERKALEDLTYKLGVSSCVIFTGVLRGHELAYRLQTCDVFITASTSENMPLSVLEAMACGLPVVAVSEKGLNEIVDEGVTGLLSPAGSVEAMADNIVEVFSHPELLDRMGSHARTRVLKYSHDKVTDSLENIYRRLLKGNI